MIVRALGAHNSESAATRMVSLLIDGVLAVDAGGLAGALSFDDQRRLKGVLLTHYHYDHVRDIPALAMNAFLHRWQVAVYSTGMVRDAIITHLLNDFLYPRFAGFPETKPAVKFTVLEPGRPVEIGGYKVLPVPVRHTENAVGYEVTSPGGKSAFFTGDTGPGLAPTWEKIKPQMLFIEVTAPDRFREWAPRPGHLTPALLGLELVSFREIRGYLPKVVAIHMNPDLEGEIAPELKAVAAEIGAEIVVASEGMEFEV